MSEENKLERCRAKLKECMRDVFVAHLGVGQFEARIQEQQLVITALDERKQLCKAGHLEACPSDPVLDFQRFMVKSESLPEQDYKELMFNPAYYNAAAQLWIRMGKPSDFVEDSAMEVLFAHLLAEFGGSGDLPEKLEVPLERVQKIINVLRLMILEHGAEYHAKLVEQIRALGAGELADSVGMIV